MVQPAGNSFWAERNPRCCPTKRPQKPIDKFVPKGCVDDVGSLLDQRQSSEVWQLPQEYGDFMFGCYLVCSLGMSRLHPQSSLLPVSKVLTPEDGVIRRQCNDL